MADPDTSTSAPPPNRLRRFRGELTRSPRRTPLINMLILIGLIALIVFLIYQFLFPGPTEETEIVDLTQSIEEIEELSTVRSHLRFGVVVTEKSGNLIVRRLADQSEEIGMGDLSSILFQDPTLLAELHAVLTWGIRLDDFESRVERTDSTIRIDMPPAELLDVNVVDRDTRIIARMEGIFRSSNSELALAAARRGESFARRYAETDTAARELAESRARDVIRLLVEQGGGRVEFVN